MAFVTTRTLRPLHICFEAYGAADDNDFKYELLVLMTGSMRELKVATRNAFGNGETDALRKAIHKAKSTLTLINDADLLAVVEDLSYAIKDDDSQWRGTGVIERFDAICESVIESLNHECENLKNLR